MVGVLAVQTDKRLVALKVGNWVVAMVDLTVESKVGVTAEQTGERLVESKVGNWAVAMVVQWDVTVAVRLVASLAVG